MARCAMCELSVVLTLTLGLLLPSSVRAAEKMEDPDEVLLREAGFKTDDESLLQFLRDRSPENPRAAVGRWITALSSDKFQEREAASIQLIRLGKIALEPLREAVKSKDVDVLARAKPCLERLETLLGITLPQSTIRLLVKRRVQGTEAAMLRYLPFAEEEDVEVELYYGLNELVVKRGSVPDLLRHGMKDLEPSRRAVAACIVAWQGTKKDRLAVQKLLEDKEGQVRLRAAQGLLAARDASGLSALVGLLREEDVALSWSAEELLHWVADETAPRRFIGTAAATEREQCWSAWRKWLQEHQATLDLSKPPRTGKGPGLLLVSGSRDVKDAPMQQQVGLCGTNGRVRAVIPLRAEGKATQLLPGNRLLVAGVLGAAEQSLQGGEKVLWRQESQRVCEARRLANGFTFLELRNIPWSGPCVMELDHQGKVRRSPSGPPERVFGEKREPQLVGRLPNGHYAWFADPNIVLECDGQTGQVRHRGRLPIPQDAGLWDGTLLPNGHWLVGINEKAEQGDVQPRRLFFGEFDSAGKELGKQSTRPGSRDERFIAAFCSGHRLGATYELREYLADAPSHLLEECDAMGRVVWEVHLPFVPTGAYNCLPLVRFGFENLPKPTFDLRSVEHREKQLRHADPVIRRTAILILSKMGARGESAVPTMFQVLEKLTPKEQLEMAQAICWASGPKSLPHLIALARHKNQALNQWGFVPLHHYPKQSREIVPVLLDGFRHSDHEVRWVAVSRAGAFSHDDRIADALLALMADKTPDQPKQPSIRLTAVSSLGKVTGAPTKRVTAALMKATNVRDVRLAECACDALRFIATSNGDIAPSIVRFLLSILRDSQKSNLHMAAIGALGFSGPAVKEAVPPLCNLLKHPMTAPNIRSCILNAFRSLESFAEDALPDLVDLLRDPQEDPGNKSYALHTLERMGPGAKKALPLLRQLATNPMNKPYLADAYKRVIAVLER